VNILSIEKSENIYNIYYNMDLLFTILGDIRNIIKSIIESLLDRYNS
jgi:hypothetical protein